MVFGVPSRICLRGGCYDFHIKYSLRFLKKYLSFFYVFLQYLNMKKYFAEFIGTYFLLSTVVGSGIMAERLSMGNDAIALFANAIATGATLIVFISIFINISGAHFNPVVSVIMYLRNKIKFNQTIFFIIVQILGGILGVWTIHYIFELEILQLSSNIRTGIPQYSSEILATFGLIFVILMSKKYNPDKIPILVGLYIT